MKRILILGSGGAGKSIFAKKLSAKLQLKLIHLDQHYWKPNWIKPDKEEWKEQVRVLCKNESWIMDGNYQSTLDIRSPAADTIIILKPNRFICLWRVIKRWCSKKIRIDPIPGCAERVGLDFIKWILWDYPQKKYPATLNLLKSHKDKKVAILKTKHDQEKFLKTV